MATSIVSSTAQKLGVLLVDEAKYLYHVSDKMKSLQAELRWMMCFLEDADNREHQEKIVCEWISEIRDIAYSAEDIVERYLHEISHHRQDGVLNTIKWFSCCICDARTLHHVGSSIDDLRARISNLIPKMQMYGIQSVGRLEGSKRNDVVREQRRTYSHTEEAPIGLEEHAKVVVGQLLENKNACVIGIAGMGGLGKTMLARTVTSNKAVKEHFQNRCAWVYLSKEFDRRRVYEEILIGLCASEDQDMRKKARELGDNELPIKICEVLKAKDCLVVIDDIWYTRSWDTLKPAFESIKSSNSKVLITTRNEGLVHYADDSGYNHHSHKLSDEDSWKLLEQKAFSRREKRAPTDDETTEMEKLGREMIKHCNGLPLAIIALGGILATRRTIKEWEIVQKNISSYLMSDTIEGGEDGGVLQVLEMSFYDLPFYLKPCFLYLGSFPEDYEIRSHRLFHLWEAEGLVSRVNSRAEIEGVSLDDIAEMYLNQLVERSMVQVYKRWPDGKIKSFQIHDIMRDMCLQKCKDVNFLCTLSYGNSNATSSHVWSSSVECTSLRRFSLHLAGGTYQSTRQLEKYDNIRSLLIFPLDIYADETLEKLSKGMGKLFSLLRVLDLQGIQILKLPEAFKNCIHLRYLSLRDTELDEIPRWVFHFKFLETLDLKIESFCRDFYHDFRALERLRHLYLPPTMFLKGSKKVMFSDDQLRQMETLKNFDLKVCQKEDLAKMVNLRIFSVGGWDHVGKKGLELLMESPVFLSGSLINHPLTIRIKAKIINEEPTIMATIGKYLKGLSIDGKIEVVDANIFPLNLKRVELEYCEIGETHLRELEKLPHLKSLELKGTAVKGSKLNFSDKAFPQLERLHLTQMEELEEWKVGEGALPNLRTLEIYKCPRLKIPSQDLPTTVEVK